MVAKFTHRVVEVDGKLTHQIQWLNEPMDIRVYDRVSKWIKRTPDYGPMNNQRLNKFKSILDSINRELGVKTPIEQLISLRNIILKDKIIKNYSRMNAVVSRVSADYDSGEDILDLSTHYDFPPLNLLRGILLHKGYNTSALYNIFANKTDPTRLLSGRDLKQFRRAEINDAESTFNQARIAEIAARNEAKFINFFKSIGVALVTQEELTESQKEKYGRAVITPDILFTDEVYINGIRVNWIDYKDYIGTKIHFLFSSNSGQSSKYTDKWGPGALCYRRGYVEGLVIPGSALLDARSLPIEFE